MVNLAAVPQYKPEPIFSTTLVETLGIRKFLEMSIVDLRQQVLSAAKDSSVSKEQFKQQKASAKIINAWLVSALMMVDGMLAEGAVKSNISLKHRYDMEKKTHHG